MIDGHLTIFAATRTYCPDDELQEQKYIDWWLR